MAQPKSFRSSMTLSTAGAVKALDTKALFNAAHLESTDSPINEFLDRIEDLNKRMPPPAAADSYSGQLILLGTVAAVESYIRTLFRRLIILDPTAQEKVLETQISYGAALHLKPDLLPEALLESMSFVSEKTMTEALRKVLGVEGQLPADLLQTLKGYVKVCQIRHCAVHRFGKLGANNAISLGMDAHSALLEKPLNIDYLGMQRIIAVTIAFVKTLNNYLFNEMISRVHVNTWTGKYNSDKKKFARYYDLFRDSKSVVPTLPAKQLHATFYKQVVNFREAKPLAASASSAASSPGALTP